MNSNATVFGMDDAAPPAAPLDAWLADGCSLAARRLAADWEIASWIADGKRLGHLGRLKFTFLSENLGLAPKRLKDALKAAETFPLGVRNTSLSVEHHAAAASLPHDAAITLLKRASVERLPASAIREAVVQYRYNNGQNYKDEDTDSTLATLQIRAWNRATPEARAMAFEQFKIAAAKGLAIVDEDEAEHA